MESYFFISDCDGALHDTREAGWSAKPLRKNFQRTHREIRTVADFKATLRNGPFTALGGYPMFFITNDGATLSFEGARRKFRSIVASIRDKSSDGWRVVGCDINYEDASMYCEVTGDRIESAYAEDAANEIDAATRAEDCAARHLAEQGD